MYLLIARNRVSLDNTYIFIETMAVTVKDNQHVNDLLAVAGVLYNTITGSLDKPYKSSDINKVLVAYIVEAQKFYAMANAIPPRKKEYNESAEMYSQDIYSSITYLTTNPYNEKGQPFVDIKGLDIQNLPETCKTIANGEYDLRNLRSQVIKTLNTFISPYGPLYFYLFGNKGATDIPMLSASFFAQIDKSQMLLFLLAYGLDIRTKKFLFSAVTDDADMWDQREKVKALAYVFDIFSALWKEPNSRNMALYGLLCNDGSLPYQDIKKTAQTTIFELFAETFMGSGSVESYLNNKMGNDWCTLCKRIHTLFQKKKYRCFTCTKMRCIDCIDEFHPVKEGITRKNLCIMCMKKAHITTIKDEHLLKHIYDAQGETQAEKRQFDQRELTDAENRIAELQSIMSVLPLISPNPGQVIASSAAASTSAGNVDASADKIHAAGPAEANEYHPPSTVASAAAAADDDNGTAPMDQDTTAAQETNKDQSDYPMDTSGKKGHIRRHRC